MKLNEEYYAIEVRNIIYYNTVWDSTWNYKEYESLDKIKYDIEFYKKIYNN